MQDIAWSGGVMSERPEVVREIHEDYIRAGDASSLDDVGPATHRTPGRPD